tara:strand:- start:18786 stop:25451 length:6666 start_codon:yes stop_codon:yes gene_type:complete
MADFDTSDDEEFESRSGPQPSQTPTLPSGPQLHQTPSPPPGTPPQQTPSPPVGPPPQQTPSPPPGTPPLQTPSPPPGPPPIQTPSTPPSRTPIHTPSPPRTPERPTSFTMVNQSPNRVLTPTARRPQSRIPQFDETKEDEPENVDDTAQRTLDFSDSSDDIPSTPVRRNRIDISVLPPPPPIRRGMRSNALGHSLNQSFTSTPSLYDEEYATPSDTPVTLERENTSIINVKNEYYGVILDLATVQIRNINNEIIFSKNAIDEFSTIISDNYVGEDIPDIDIDFSFSQNGKKIIISAYGYAKVYNIITGKQIGTILQRETAQNSLYTFEDTIVSFNTQHLDGVPNDKVINIWSEQKYPGSDGFGFQINPISKIVLKDDIETDVSIIGITISPTPDLKVLVYCSDYSALVYNCTNGLLLSKLDETKRHNNNITCACFNPNSTLVSTVCLDGDIRIWNPDNINQFYSESLTTNGQLLSIDFNKAFNDDMENYFITSQNNGYITIYRIEPRLINEDIVEDDSILDIMYSKQICPDSNNLQWASFSNTGNRFVCSCYESKLLFIYSFQIDEHGANIQLLYRKEFDTGPIKSLYRPFGDTTNDEIKQYIIIKDNRPIYDNIYIRKYELHTEIESPPFIRINGEINLFDVCSNNNKIVTYSVDTSLLSLWDTISFNFLWNYAINYNYIEQLKVSKDCKNIVLLTGDTEEFLNSINIIGIETGQIKSSVTSESKIDKINISRNAEYVGIIEYNSNTVLLRNLLSNNPDEFISQKEINLDTFEHEYKLEINTYSDIYVHTDLLGNIDENKDSLKIAFTCASTQKSDGTYHTEHTVYNGLFLWFPYNNDKNVFIFNENNYHEFISCSISNSGNYLIGGTLSGYIFIWDIIKEKNTFINRIDFYPNTRSQFPITYCEFSDDDKYLLGFCKDFESGYQTNGFVKVINFLNYESIFEKEDVGYSKLCITNVLNEEARRANQAYRNAIAAIDKKKAEAAVAIALEEDNKRIKENHIRMLEQQKLEEEVFERYADIRNGPSLVLDIRKDTKLYKKRYISGGGYKPKTYDYLEYKNNIVSNIFEFVEKYNGFITGFTPTVMAMDSMGISRNFDSNNIDIVFLIKDIKKDINTEGISRKDFSFKDITTAFEDYFLIESRICYEMEEKDTLQLPFAVRLSDKDSHFKNFQFSPIIYAHYRTFNLSKSKSKPDFLDIKLIFTITDEKINIHEQIKTDILKYYDFKMLQSYCYNNKIYLLDKQVKNDIIKENLSHSNKIYDLQNITSVISLEKIYDIFYENDLGIDPYVSSLSSIENIFSYLCMGFIPENINKFFDILKLKHYSSIIHKINLLKYDISDFETIQLNIDDIEKLASDNSLNIYHEYQNLVNNTIFCSYSKRLNYNNLTNGNIYEINFKIPIFEKTSSIEVYVYKIVENSLDSVFFNYFDSNYYVNIELFKDSLKYIKLISEFIKDSVFYKNLYETYSIDNIITTFKNDTQHSNKPSTISYLFKYFKSKELPIIPFLNNELDSTKAYSLKYIEEVAQKKSDEMAQQLENIMFNQEDKTITHADPAKTIVSNKIATAKNNHNFVKKLVKEIKSQIFLNNYTTFVDYIICLNDRLYKSPIRLCIFTNIWTTNLNICKIVQDIKHNHYLLSRDKQPSIQDGISKSKYTNFRGIANSDGAILENQDNIMKKYIHISEFAAVWDSFVSKKKTPKFFQKYDFGVGIAESESEISNRVNSPTHLSHDDLIDFGGLTKSFFTELPNNFLQLIEENNKLIIKTKELVKEKDKYDKQLEKMDSFNDTNYVEVKEKIDEIEMLLKSNKPFFTDSIKDIKDDFTSTHGFINDERTFLELPLWKRLFNMMILSYINECGPLFKTSDKLLNYVFNTSKMAIPYEYLITACAFVSKSIAISDTEFNVKLICRLILSNELCDNMENSTKETLDMLALTSSSDYFVPESLNYEIEGRPRISESNLITLFKNIITLNSQDFPEIKPHVKTIIKDFISFYQSLIYSVAITNNNNYFDDLMLYFESFDTNFYYNHMCQHFNTIILNSPEVKQILIKKIVNDRTNGDEEYHEELSDEQLQVIREVDEYIKKYIQELSIDQNNKPTISDFINFVTGTKSVPNNLEFQVTFYSNWDDFDHKYPKSHSCFNRLEIFINNVQGLYDYSKFKELMDVSLIPVDNVIEDSIKQFEKEQVEREQKAVKVIQKEAKKKLISAPPKTGGVMKKINNILKYKLP